mgnify:CR=1 FL=1
MLKKTITYTDYDGVERTEDFYFNLSKAEVAEMELSNHGGMERLIQQIAMTQDRKRLVELFKEIILRSYGEKSLDGRRFMKSKELSEAFSQTEAYSELFMQLATDPDIASDFINGVLPSTDATPEQRAEAEKQAKGIMDATPVANLSSGLDIR